MANLKVSLIIQGVDRATAPVRNIAKATRGLGGALAQATRPTAALKTALDAVSRATAKVGPVATVAKVAVAATGHAASGLSKTAAITSQAVARLKERLDSLGQTKAAKTLRSVGLAAGGLGKRIGGAALRGAGTAAGFAAVAGVGAATTGFIGLGKSAVSTSADFEAFNEMLTTLEGSGAKAKQSMAWVKDFAQTTPNEVREVLDAFVRLRSYGIEPTDGTLRSLGNAAAIFKPMGKSLADVVEALADAQTGEFERLKEFGIKASEQGGRVAFTYSKNNKQMTVSSSKAAKDINKAIRSIFDAKYSGAMDRQAKTFDGQLSMLSDAWTNFRLEVGNAGLFDHVKGQLTTFLGWIDRATKSGELQRWAKEISASLIRLFDGLANIAKAIDWVSLIKWMGDVAQRAATTAEAIGKIAEAMRPLVEWNKGLVNFGRRAISWLPDFNEQESPQRRQQPPFATSALPDYPGPISTPRLNSATWQRPAVGVRAKPEELRGTITVKAEPGTQVREVKAENPGIGFDLTRGFAQPAF